MTLIVIIVCMVFVVAFTGMCSINPGAPENGPVQKVDAQQFLDIEARSMPFPVRYPQMPETWTTNSARRSNVAGTPAPIVGWVTAKGAYLQLIQTNQTVDAAVKDHDEYARKEKESKQVGEHTVRIYTNEDHPEARALWVADLGDVRLVVSGSADESEYSQLIDVALHSPVLPSGAVSAVPSTVSTR